MSSDRLLRESIGAYPVPELDGTPWTTPVPRSEATVAIVTTAALHRQGDERFAASDASFREIPHGADDLVLGHWSPNFDRAGFAADPYVVFPQNRLAELAARGTIGRVAPRHLAFAGNQDETVGTIRHDSGPAAAALLRADGVDVVLLTPV